jgi:hypothetical protein
MPPLFGVSLMNLSDKPPTGGFKGSTANIDLTDNTGRVHRVIVDLAIGLCYTSRLQQLRPNSAEMSHSAFGPSLAETRRVHQYGAHLVNTQGISTGTSTDNLRSAVFRYPNRDKYLDSTLFSPHSPDETRILSASKAFFG